MDLNKYRAAMRHLHLAIEEDDITIDDAVDTIEAHQRLLLDAIAQLAQHIDTAKLPAHVQQLLSQLGITPGDDAHSAYLRVLTDAASDLTLPRHPNDFFQRYDRLLPHIVAHDMLATRAIDELVRIMTNGESCPGEAADIISSYLVETDKIERDVTGS